MARQEIFLGTVANDQTGDDLRAGGQMINDMFLEQYALNSQTINAAAIEYAAGATDEAKITLAIADAVLNGADRVYIPASMLPYDASLVTFDDSVQMVREGGPPGEVYDVLAYGAAGDGVTDDTAPIQVAYTAWAAAARPAILLFAPRKYRVIGNLAATIEVTSFETCRTISGYGAVIYSDAGTGWVMTLGIGTTGVVNVRYITFEGLGFLANGASDLRTGMFQLNGGNVNTRYLHRWVLRDISGDQFMGIGIEIRGDAFEGVVDACRLQSATANVTYPCFHCLSDGTGVVSSIDFISCNTDRGKYGILALSPQPGVNVFGGTFIQSAAEGVRIENCRNGLVAGVHVENCWQSGVASPSWATSQAGILLSGGGTAIGCYGTDSTSKMRYVVRSFCNPVQTVIGGFADGTVEYYLRADGGAATTRITAIGLEKGTVGAIHVGTVGCVQSIGNSGGTDIAGGTISADRGDANVTLALGSDAEVQRFATTLGANRTVTLPTAFAGAKFTIVRTGLGSFTLDVGGLKTIPSATAAFVDVMHDGTAWRLARYGLL